MFFVAVYLPTDPYLLSYSNTPECNTFTDKKVHDVWLPSNGKHLTICSRQWTIQEAFHTWRSNMSPVICEVVMWVPRWSNMSPTTGELVMVWVCRRHQKTRVSKRNNLVKDQHISLTRGIPGQGTLLSSGTSVTHFSDDLMKMNLELLSAKFQLIFQASTSIYWVYQKTDILKIVIKNVFPRWGDIFTIWVQFLFTDVNFIFYHGKKESIHF